LRKDKPGCSAPAIFKAFSDATRLRILYMLCDGEMCVCDIAGALGASQPKVSRHLAYLRKAGLVLPRKEGLWIHYSLRRKASPLHRNLLSALRSCARLDKRLNADRRKSRKLRAKANRCA